MPHPSTTAVERELRHLLIRHLPVGLEGIGIAQTAAVLDMLTRHQRHLRPVADTDQHRDGLRLLLRTAHQHHATVRQRPGGRLVCGTCGTSKRPVPWPCPVWQSAELLGLVEPASRAQVV